MERISRREFLKRAFVAGLSLSAVPVLGYSREETVPEALAQGSSPDPGGRLIIAQGRDPGEMTRRAIEAWGGMGRVVKKGDRVVIKPNIAWDRTPEQAANTNPEVVAVLVALACAAGASQVKVLDHTCNDPRRSYARSGIGKAARAAGAEVEFVESRGFREHPLPEGRKLKQWPFYGAILDADVLINVPVAKQHSTSKLTMGLKNVFGMIGEDRGSLHPDIHQNIADLNTGVRVDLTVLDAYRILLRNGPTGGRLEDVKTAGQVIVGSDRVAVDAYGAELFGLSAAEIGYIKRAHDMGLGEMDYRRLEVKEITV